ncbi:uncharacterized protein NEMAJ01_0560 [Nematocida major]|uniref:uncharacterized protein n=1 Tax=Nematocida major TaxID=1912982 RepID=UPI00200834C1|nr:uncharacterized protein NEMAJ01_0560 [Nematocida major]KAH9385664.1 hypothetical protein NEMAJ01_0560 [Nematocida major]
MRGEYEDELEFFSFLPADFHMDLYQGMSKMLVSSLGSSPDIRGRMDRIETALQKNMLIFERFTLRNIFTFPESFVYERKQGPRTAHEHGQLKDEILSLSLQNAEIASLRETLQQKKAFLRDVEQKYAALQGIPELSAVLEGIRELNRLMRETREMKKQYMQGAQQRPRPPKKELEEEIRKNECADLERRIPMSVLSLLEKTLS